AAKGKNDFYAGADGNVYKKTDNGWEKWDNGGWQPVNPPKGSDGNLTGAENRRGQNQPGAGNRTGNVPVAGNRAGNLPGAENPTGNLPGAGNRAGNLPGAEDPRARNGGGAGNAGGGHLSGSPNRWPRTGRTGYRLTN